MLQVAANACFSYKSKIGGRALHHQERGYLHHATNSQIEQLVALGENNSSGPEQLQMLQLRQSIASSIEGIFTPSYELTKRTASKARAASRHVGQCNARACQPAAQYSAGIVQCSSLFLNERTGLHRKSVFLR